MLFLVCLATTGLLQNIFTTKGFGWDVHGEAGGLKDYGNIGVCLTLNNKNKEKSDVERSKFTG